MASLAQNKSECRTWYLSFSSSTLGLSPDPIYFSTSVCFISTYSLIPRDHLMTVQDTAVILNLDYNYSFLTVLSASVLASLQCILHIGNEYDHFLMQTWSLYLSPWNTFHVFPLLCSPKSLTYEVLFDLALFLLPLLVSFLWPSDCQNVVSQPPQDSSDPFRESCFHDRTLLFAFFSLHLLLYWLCKKHDILTRHLQ